MDDSTSAPGSRGKAFPTTRWSLIRKAADPASREYRESLEQLAAAYWRPIYAYFRRKWSEKHEEARDLTQDFFVALCEKEFLRELSPRHGRFRSYVMAALDNFARLRYRSQSRLKRGGGVAHFALEVGEGFEPAAGPAPEKVFLQEWARSVLGRALADLEAGYKKVGQEKAFRLFVERDVDPPAGAEPSYEDLARRHGVSVTDVTNILFRARKKLRELVLNKVRDTVATEEEAEAEVRELFKEEEAES